VSHGDEPKGHAMIEMSEKGHIKKAYCSYCRKEIRINSDFWDKMRKGEEFPELELFAIDGYIPTLQQERDLEINPPSFVRWDGYFHGIFIFVTNPNVLVCDENFYQQGFMPYIDACEKIKGTENFIFKVHNDSEAAVFPL
jgi:hypothetical protein